MRSLRDFHANTYKDTIYQDLLKNAIILYRKGLHLQSNKILSKAKTIAQEDENFLQLLDILKWEQHIIHQKNDLNKLAAYAENEVTAELHVLEKYRNLLLFKLLNDRIFIKNWQMGVARNESEIAQFNAVIDNFTHQKEEKPLSNEAAFYYNNAFFTHYYCTGQLEQCYEAGKRLVSTIEESFVIKRNILRNRNKYISALHNLTAITIEIHRFGEAQNLLNKLKEIPFENVSQEITAFKRVYILQLQLYCKTGNFIKAKACADEIGERFRTFAPQIDQQSKLAFYYNFTYAYFGANDFGEALDWNNELLNDPSLEMREDIHCMARLLNLLIHYELGNEMLLDYIVKSAYRYINRRKRLFQVETILLQYIPKLPKQIEATSLNEMLLQLKEELLPLSKDTFEKQAFEYFDLLSWVESKLTNQPFSEIVNDKVEVSEL